MDKLFDKLPYNFLAGVKPLYIWLTGGALGLGLAVAYIFVGYNPAQTEYAALETTKTETETTLKQYQGAVAQKPIITAEVATLAGTLEEKKRHLPLANEIPDLLSQVTDVGNFLGIEILKFRLNTTVSKDFYKEIPISMTFYGDYYRTAGFFDSLQSLLRLLNVSNFRMEITDIQEVAKGEDGEMFLDSVPRVQTTVEVNAFAYIEGSENTGP